MTTMGTLPNRSGAYRWWYLDAVSDDGRDGLVVIFFSGSVFSPYYAARLRAGKPALPSEHTAVHVVMYRGGKRVGWLLAEHDRTISLSDDGRTLEIGRSRWSANERGWTLEIRDAHGPFRMHGRVEIDAPAEDACPEPVPLCPGVAEHYWQPKALRTTVRAKFAQPQFEFETPNGYHDTNWGDEPLERSLRGWDWARMHTDTRGRDAAAVVYDVRARDGRRFRHVVATDLLPQRPLPDTQDDAHRNRTGWAIDVPASVRGRTRDAEWSASVSTVWEDTPFYARYSLSGDGLAGVGETLDLRRFDRWAVRWMLRWRTWRH